MRNSNSGHAGHAIQRILELSADAQITRRKTPKHSPAFHSLTGAIVAYSKTLAILTALQQREEFFKVVFQYDLSERVAVVAEEQYRHRAISFCPLEKQAFHGTAFRGKGEHI